MKKGFMGLFFRTSSYFMESGVIYWNGNLQPSALTIVILFQKEKQIGLLRQGESTSKRTCSIVLSVREVIALI